MANQSFDFEDEPAQRQRALSRWEDEGGAGIPDVQMDLTLAPSLPPSPRLDEAELVGLHKHEIILDYRVRDRGEDRQSVRQQVPIIWTPAGSAGKDHGSSATSAPTAFIAAGGLPSSMGRGDYLRAGTATVSATQSNVADHWTAPITTWHVYIASWSQATMGFPRRPTSLNG